MTGFSLSVYVTFSIEISLWNRNLYSEQSFMLVTNLFCIAIYRTHTCPTTVRIVIIIITQHERTKPIPLNYINYKYVYLDSNAFSMLCFFLLTLSLFSVCYFISLVTVVAWWMTGGVGKSSLVLRFIKGTFRESYIPTIEDTYRQVRFYPHIQFSVVAAISWLYKSFVAQNKTFVSDSVRFNFKYFFEPSGV